MVTDSSFEDWEEKNSSGSWDVYHLVIKWAAQNGRFLKDGSQLMDAKIDTTKNDGSRNAPKIDDS